MSDANPSAPPVQPKDGLRTPRVLVLSTHTPHIDRRILHEVNALSRSGREVTLVSLPAIIPRTLLDARVELIMPEPAPAVEAEAPQSLLLRIGRKLPQPLRALGGECLNRLAKVRQELERRSADTNFFLTHAPQQPYDAIHCHDLPTLPAASFIRWRSARQARVIYDSHELYPLQTSDRRLQRYWTRVERRHIRSADAVITVNESIADELSARYRIARPVVIYNSRDPSTPTQPLTREEFFQFFGTVSGGFNVLFQGSLADDRNLANLAAAFDILGGDYRLFILGAGPAEKTIQQVQSQLRLKNVYLGGWVEQDRLMQFTTHADLGVIPYVPNPGVLNMLYCTPNKLFEFIEAGLPICASDLPELRKLVQEQGIGRVYNLTTAQSIAEALKDMRARLARGDFPTERRAVVREELGWPRQEQILLELYDRLGV